MKYSQILEFLACAFIIAFPAFKDEDKHLRYTYYCVISFKSLCSFLKYMLISVDILLFSPFYERHM